MLFGGFLLTLVMTPFIFLSMIMRNIVPSMIVGSILVLVNIFSYGCPWGPYFPWMACYIISSNTITDYSCTLLTPIATVLITFIIGTVISYGYFKIKDVSL
ncbi:MAG: bacitracin ABC transporter permease, partial [Methanobrevibacter sp.]|nr:bacitracin ABC transporter permease [Methanobrevibacter sp.]